MTESFSSAPSPVPADPSRRPGRLGIGVVGAGKVGAVLGAALRAAGHGIVGVHAVSEESRERAAALLPEVPVLSIPQIMERSEVVLFAVPDDALEQLVTGLAEAGHVTGGQILVHTSGRHGTEVFRAARERGAIGLAMHPAMTFTGLSLDLARLRHAVMGVSGPAGFLPVVQALAVETGAEPVVLAEGDRPLYHAALSHAANHAVTLVAQAAQILRSIGVEDPERMLGPLLRAGLENALASGDGALTGPVARGDAGTVRDHREVLEVYAREERAADIASAYTAMARATAQRALRRGALSEAEHAALLRALGGQDEQREQDEEPDQDEPPGQGEDPGQTERTGLDERRGPGQPADGAS